MNDPVRGHVLGNTRVAALAAAAAAGLALASGACGGGGSSSPSTPSAPAPTTPSALTVTISSAGVTPRSLQVPMGGRVTFVNTDSRSHQIMSDPNPLHNDCPAVNDAGMIGPGQSRETGSFVVVRACGYHDHMFPDSTSLQGVLLIGGAEDPGTRY